MKMTKATIEFSDKSVQDIEFEGGSVIELAHELIQYAQPKLEIVIPESKIESFRQEAKKDYMRTTKLFRDFEAYQELYVKMKCSEYIRLEHAKHAYNEAVLAYEEKIKSLKQQ